MNGSLSKTEVRKKYFPSVSYYFHIPIIFDYLDIHCPTEVMAVGTIIFPVRVEEQIFFQYGLSSTSPYQSFVVLNKNRSYES